MIFIIVMIIEDLIKKILKEATGDSTGSRGSYAPPLQPGIRDFDKSKLAPFTDPLTNYKSPLVAYDSYDHDWDLRSDQIRALEKTARKISNFIKKHPDATNSDEDGNVLNRTPSGKENSKKLEIVPVKHKKNKSKINEITTTTTAGEYSGPQELGLRKWKKSELGAFDIESDSPANNVFKKRTTKKNVYKIVGGWEPQQGKFEVPTYDVDGEHESQLSKGQLTNDPIEWYRPLKRKPVTKKDILKRQKMNEDLAVWFGEKKKPKGSSQPKGPWVDICRKVNGKHPPCGRSDASEGSYPKCRAAGVAGKMSDSEKRNACSQKRKAEKNDPQSGKGQKPVMVSHKKKTNENMKTKIITLTENDLTRIVKRVLNEDIKDVPKHEKLGLVCKTYSSGDNFKSVNYTDLIAARLVERTSKFEITFDIEQNMTTRTLQSYEKENQEMVTISFEKPTQNFKDFLNNRFPNIDWEKTELGYIMFNKSHGNQQTFCSAVNPSPLWETYFTDNKILYNL